MRKVRTAYDRVRVGKAFVDADGVQLQGRTKQSFKDECDIHNILKQYKETGLISHLNKKKEMYGEFILPGEYQESLQVIMDAQEAFADLPAVVRKRFDNDPEQFLAFLADPENAAEALDLGLRIPNQVPDEQERSDPKAVAGGTDERSEES